eukprot:m.420090 g.420090  ORF g.420090 m.420090 type:complete len:767 (-) comp21313_c0_seq4:2806-5106(-)
MSLRKWKVDPERRRPWKSLKPISPTASGSRMSKRATSHDSHSWAKIDVTNRANFDILVEELRAIENANGNSSVLLLPPIALASGCLQHMKKYDDASSYAREGLRIAKASGDKEWEGLFLRRLSQTQTHAKNHEAGEAAVYLAQSLPPSERDEGMVLNLLAAARAGVRSGNAFKAHCELERIRAILDRTSAKTRKFDTRFIVETYVLDAVALNLLGRFEEAEQNAKQATMRAREASVPSEETMKDTRAKQKPPQRNRRTTSTPGRSTMPKKPAESTDQLLFAATRALRTAVARQGRYAEADRLCTQTIAAATALFGETSGQVSLELLEHVDVLVMQVRSLDSEEETAGTSDAVDGQTQRQQKGRMTRKAILSRAYAAATRATVIYTELDGETSHSVAHALAQTAEVCSLLGNQSEAISLQADAVSIYNKNLGPDHTQTHTESSILKALRDAHAGGLQHPTLGTNANVDDHSSQHRARQPRSQRTPLDMHAANAYVGDGDGRKEPAVQRSESTTVHHNAHIARKNTHAGMHHPRHAVTVESADGSGGSEDDVTDNSHGDVFVDSCNGIEFSDESSGDDITSGASDSEQDTRIATPDFGLYTPCSNLECLMVESEETPFQTSANGQAYCSTDCRWADTSPVHEPHGGVPVTDVYPRPFVQGNPVDEVVSAVLSSMGRHAHAVRVRHFHRNAYLVQTDDDQPSVLVRIDLDRGVQIRVWNGWQDVDTAASRALPPHGTHAPSPAMALLQRVHDAVLRNRERGSVQSQTSH